MTGPQPDPLRAGTTRWHHVPEILVALLVSGGLLLVAQNYWRTGLASFGAGVLTAAAARLTLPPGEVPFLVNRSRAVDVAALLVLGGVVLLLAYTLIYEPPFSLG